MSRVLYTDHYREAVNSGNMKALYRFSIKTYVNACVNNLCVKCKSCNYACTFYLCSDLRIPLCVYLCTDLPLAQTFIQNYGYLYLLRLFRHTDIFYLCSFVRSHRYLYLLPLFRLADNFTFVELYKYFYLCSELQILLPLFKLTDTFTFVQTY